MADIPSALAAASVLLNWWHGADLDWVSVSNAADTLIDGAFDDDAVRAATFGDQLMSLFTTCLLLEPARIQTLMSSDLILWDAANSTDPLRFKAFTLDPTSDFVAPRVKMLRAITTWSKGTWRTAFEPRKEGVAGWITTNLVAGAALAGTIGSDWDPLAKIEALTMLNKAAYPLEWQPEIVQSLNALDETLPQLPMFQLSIDLENAMRSTLAALSRDVRGSIGIQQASLATAKLGMFSMNLPDGSKATLPPPPTPIWYENPKLWIGLAGLGVGGFLAARRSK